MYESPIEIIQNDIADGIRTKLENDVCSVICSYGINVNREELIKALNYDRGQYDKGFQDGYEKGYQQAKEDLIKFFSTNF